MPILNKIYQGAKEFPATSSRYVLHNSYKNLFGTKKSFNEKDLYKISNSLEYNKQISEVERAIKNNDYETAIYSLNSIMTYAKNNKTKKLSDIVNHGLIQNIRNAIKHNNYETASIQLNILEKSNDKSKSVKKTITQLYNEIKKYQY